MRPAIAKMIHPTSLGDILSQTSYHAKCWIRLTRMYGWTSSGVGGRIRQGEPLFQMAYLVDALLWRLQGELLLQTARLHGREVVVVVEVVLIASSTSSISGGNPGMSW